MARTTKKKKKRAVVTAFTMVGGERRSRMVEQLVEDGAFECTSCNVIRSGVANGVHVCVCGSARAIVSGW
jgi:hypothetical protein